MGSKDWDELDALWRADNQPDTDSKGYPVHARGHEPKPSQKMTDAEVDAATFTDGLSPAERRLVERYAEMK